MTTKEFLQFLQSKQISVRLNATGQLAIKATNGAIDEQILTELRQRKPEIVAFLEQAQQVLETAIPSSPENAHYPVSAAQKRLWVLDQITPNLRAYNIPYICYLNGPLNRDALQKSFQYLIDRHESLRTLFRLEGTVPVQVVQSKIEFKLEYENLQGKVFEEKLQQQVATSVVDHLFDLSKGSLIKVKLFQLTEQKYILALVLHHIIADAWSIGVMLRELAEVYGNFCRGKETQLVPLGIQYRDFAVWQKKQLEQSAMNRQEQFWETQLAGTLPSLNFPTDFKRPEQKNFKGKKIIQRLHPDLSKQLQQLGQEKGATFFQVLLAGVQAFLHRYTADKDLIVGTTTAGRNRAELQNQIGFYVNILPVRQRFSDEMTFDQLLEQTKDNYQKANDFGDYPFGTLIEKMEIVSTPNRNPVFDVLVEMIGSELDESNHAALHDVELLPFDFDTPISKFDMAFRFIEDAQGVDCMLEYDTALYVDWRMENLIDNFTCFLQNLIQAPQHTLQSIACVREAEQKEIYYNFNNTSEEETTSESLLTLWEKTAAQFSEKTALVYESQSLSYAQLNAQANQVCHHLREVLKVQNGDRVAILAGRTPLVVAGIWGILKSGATFVPIDPNYPEEKMGKLLLDAAANVLLLEAQQLFKIPAAYTGTSVALDMLPEVADTPSPLTIDPKSPAYLLYTSGSSGEAKGVLVSHQNITHYLRWANNYYFDGNDQQPFGLFTSLSFDLSMTGLLGTLLRGGTLHLYSEDRAVDEVLKEIADKNSPIKATKLTPSHLTLLGHLGLSTMDLQTLIVGGEALYPKHLEMLFALQNQLVIHNEYGPTETTVGCTVATYKAPAEPVTIGSPIANTQIYILDKNRQTVAIGMPGEIYVGGVGVAIGYHQQTELTAARFLNNPFEKQGRIYRTGDRGSWLPDGTIQYWGRVDNQVKIRGYRVEPGEVEKALLTLPEIQNAVVVAVDNEQQNKELRAYLQGTHLPDLPSLYDQLEQILPSYMIPSNFYAIQQIPLNINGKADAAALLESSEARLLTDAEYLAPTNNLETWLLEVFQPFVEVNPLGTRQNFFTAGLDSLKIVMVQSQLEKNYPGAVKIHEVFSNPTIEKLAALISERTGIPTAVAEEAEILDF